MPFQKAFPLEPIQFGKNMLLSQSSKDVLPFSIGRSPQQELNSSNGPQLCFERLEPNADGLVRVNLARKKLTDRLQVEPDLV